MQRLVSSGQAALVLAVEVVDIRCTPLLWRHAAQHARCLSLTKAIFVANVDVLQVRAAEHERVYQAMPHQPRRALREPPRVVNVAAACCRMAAANGNGQESWLPQRRLRPDKVLHSACWALGQCLRGRCMVLRLAKCVERP